MRKSLGWNAHELAEKAGIPYPTLRDIEAGYNHGREETRAAIAAALGCTMADLYVDGTRPRSKAHLVAEMTTAELEELVTRASKRDGSINLEIERLKSELADIKKAIPQLIFDIWPKAPVEVKAFVLYILSGQAEYLKQLSAIQVEKVRTAMRATGMHKMAKG